MAQQSLRFSRSKMFCQLGLCQWITYCHRASSRRFRGRQASHGSPSPQTAGRHHLRPSTGHCVAGDVALGRTHHGHAQASLGGLAPCALAIAQRTAQNLERLNRDQLANALGLHFMTRPLGNDFTALHHQVSIGQFFSKVVVLLTQ